MEPTARSLILDLLSTLRRGTMPVRALVEAGMLFGLAENNVRVSLARLRASGRVERDERGRYRLGPAVEAIRDQLQGWRALGRRKRRWRGDWIAIHQPRLGRGPVRRRRDRATLLLGFRALEPGFWLRPDNLRGGIEQVRTRWVQLARSPSAPSTPAEARSRSASRARVMLVRDLDPVTEHEARALWPLVRLVDDAHAETQALRHSAARLSSRSTEEAMVETFLVGGRVLRQLVRDPLLPAAILDPAPLDALLEEMTRYDELGRAAWAPFLASHDVPHRALPLDGGALGPAVLKPPAAASGTRP